jgi:hypothetical protein
MKKILLSLISVFLPLAFAFGQSPETTVRWQSKIANAGEDIYELILDGTLADGWHTYGLDHEFSATTVQFESLIGCELSGNTYEISKSVERDGEKLFFDKIVLGQKIRLTAKSGTVKGTVTWMGCTDEACSTPTDWDFFVTFGDDPAISTSNNTEITDNKNVSNQNNIVTNINNQTIIQDPVAITEETEKAGGSLWALIIEAILWGFAMLLTPCVFPMVPMTISFFMKGSSSATVGRFKAFMYGLFIVLLYTVPISIIIGATWIFGGETVTADIFNWLATHWLPNIIFFIVFMVFAASFFGAFEITLPSSIVNRSDRNSDKTGLAGVFFMALTLVLVSFSCTGPIVGSVLIKSTQGQFWAPMVTMLAFSVAFALPFTILALFPSLLEKVKKGNGAWLNSVKVVLGFIEVALGLKFLSVPDQTYHWGILDREVYLAIWIVVFTLLGFYLLGKIKFRNDEEVKHIGIFRLSLVILVFSFVVYMIPGMFGAPLKALSGYIPPMETQDFVMSGSPHASAPQSVTNVGDAKTIDMPLGLRGYITLEDGLNASAKAGKPLFVDITGHGCTNCREMEQRVWSDERVLDILNNDFVIAALYTDDKTRLEEKDWIVAENGKVLKDLGRVNSYIVRTRFGVNAQPNYVILSSDGKQLVPIRGYNLDIEDYIKFLKSGIEAYKAAQ